MRSAFRGPAHQLAVRMRINNCTHGHNNYCPINQPAHHAPTTARAPRVCTLVPFIIIIITINPRRACAARVTVVVLCVCLSVCLSVCLFVHDYSRTTGYEAAYERYQHLQCHKGTKIKQAILLKRLRSRDMA